MFFYDRETNSRIFINDYELNKLRVRLQNLAYYEYTTKQFNYNKYFESARKSLKISSNGLTQIRDVKGYVAEIKKQIEKEIVKYEIDGCEVKGKNDLAITDEQIDGFVDALESESVRTFYSSDDKTEKTDIYRVANKAAKYFKDNNIEISDDDLSILVGNLFYTYKTGMLTMMKNTTKYHTVVKSFSDKEKFKEEVKAIIELLNMTRKDKKVVYNLKMKKYPELLRYVNGLRYSPSIYRFEDVVEECEAIIDEKDNNEELTAIAQEMMSLPERRDVPVRRNTSEKRRQL